MWGRISALFLLALGLIKTLLLRLTAVNSLEGFAERYGSEGILRVTDEEARILRRAGRCVACGLCDAGEGSRIAASQVGYRGMMSFALSGTRSLPDYDAAALSIGEVPVAAFEQAERVCPVDVPLVQLAALVRGHAARQTQQAATSEARSARGS